MVLINGKAKPAEGKHAFLRDKDRVWCQLVHLGLARYGEDPERVRKFVQKQYHSIYGEFARKTISNTKPIEIGGDLSRLIQHNLIRWSRGRATA